MQLTIYISINLHIKQKVKVDSESNEPKEKQKKIAENESNRKILIQTNFKYTF